EVLVVAGVDLHEHAQHALPVVDARLVEERQEHAGARVGGEGGRGCLGGLVELLHVHRDIAERRRGRPTGRLEHRQVGVEGRGGGLGWGGGRCGVAGWGWPSVGGWPALSWGGWSAGWWARRGARRSAPQSAPQSEPPLRMRMEARSSPNPTERRWAEGTPRVR